MEKEGSGSVRVLLIPPIHERNYEPFFKSITPEFKKLFTFYCIKPIPRHENGTVNYASLLHIARRIIKDEKISVIFANKTIGTLVKGILCQESPSIRGPTAESIFLCCHKYYTTTVIDSRREKLPYFVLTLKEDQYDLAYQVLDRVKAPCYVRACLGSGHSTYCFHNRDQLIQLLSKCRKDVRHITSMQRYLIENFVDLRKYPMAASDSVIMNCFLNRFTALPGSTWVNVNVEACVFKGEILPWAVSDAITLPHGQRQTTQIFPGFQMPSRLSRDQQESLWEEFMKDIRRLIEHGFNDSFVHAEYMVFEDDYIHLVTINGCPNVKNTKLYVRATDNGNNIEAALQIGLGIRPKRPKLKGVFVVNYFFLVFENGKADQLLHFDKALRNPDVWLRYLPGQDIAIEPAKDYAIVGSVTVTGKDFDECVAKIKALRKEILKMPELVPLAC